MNLPNTITIFRLLLVPVFVWQFVSGHLEISALIFFIAWVSDVMDGYIARKYDMVTTFGKIFDPLADKLMTVTALFLLALNGYITLLLPIVVLAKEIIMGVGGLLMYKKLKDVAGAKWVGKIATFLFAAAVILMLFDPTRQAANIIIWIALGVAFIALITYIINYFKTVTDKKSNRREA